MLPLACPAHRSMKKSFLLNPSFLIVAAIVAGALFGALVPGLAVRTKIAGDLFIQAIRFLAGPIVFCTVAAGIARMGDLRQLGQVGIKAIVYFETLSTLALLAGFAGAAVLQPGAGFRAGTLPSPEAAAGAVGNTAMPLASVLQRTLASSFVLQMLVLAIVAGLALALAGRRAAAVSDWLSRAEVWLHRAINLVLKAAPLAAFAAMAYTVGRYGLGSLQPLARFVGSLYLVTALFVALVMGAVARWCGASLWRFIAYIKEELILVFGTASSVVAMPRLIEKMRLAGCGDTVTGVVIPAGYSFNLNGSNIYLGLASMFIVQALHVDLHMAQFLSMFAVSMVASKSASGVAGSAFIALTAILSTVPGIPADGLLLVFGVERLLKCRPLANLAGNGIACLAVSAWTKQLDSARLSMMTCRNTTSAG